MIVIPGDTPAETISAIIADEAAIGMVNSKTTAVRVIPAIGKRQGGTGIWGGCWHWPYYGGQPPFLRPVYPPGRADPRSAAEPEKLKKLYQEGRVSPPSFVLPFGGNFPLDVLKCCRISVENT